jgi:Haem-NO-binding
MKGIIFNLLEEVVTEQFGEKTWDQLLDQAQVEGSFTSLGNYPDEDLFKLVAAASAALKQTPDAVVRWFGVRALPLLARKYPAFFDRHQSTRPFILTLNGIIHPEVRKLYPGADTPEFDFDTSSSEVLVMNYRSKRKLCSLVEGFTEGAATHYNETVSIQHPLCMHRGDECCRLEFSFARKLG